MHFILDKIMKLSRANYSECVFMFDKDLIRYFINCLRKLIKCAQTIWSLIHLCLLVKENFVHDYENKIICENTVTGIDS